MTVRWMPEQIEAIESRGVNLLVAAAAGSGKTSVLVERIIRQITGPVSPVDIDRLLVVTFTNAAATEMRERIARALAEKGGAGPDARRLERQAILLNRAQISTLHAFCMEVLRQYFYRIDLDPSFRVADETEAALIQLEVLEDLFERCYALGDDTPFTRLVESYGGNRDDSSLAPLVLDVFRFARSTPDPVGWLEKVAARFELPETAGFDELPWTAPLKNAVVIEVEGLLAAANLAAELAVRPGGPVPYLEALHKDREMLENLLQLCRGADWETLAGGFDRIRFSQLKSCKKGEAGDQLKKQVQDLRDSVKKRVSSLREQYFSIGAAELVAGLRGVAPLVRELAGLTRDFGEAYQKAKAGRGVVDFSDLEHLCLKVLGDPAPGGYIPTAAALELRRRFEEVLVDEYQDTNAVQEAIINLVSRQDEARPNLFAVGDVKQSIYRFRLAEPGLFLEKYRRYPVTTGGRERRIDLNRNFRSRSHLVDAVNFIFRQLMTGSVAEISYDRAVELVYGADYPPAGSAEEQSEPEMAKIPEAVEFYLVERENQTGTGSSIKEGPPEENESDGEAGAPEELEEELEAEQKEARLIARRIREMVAGGPRGEAGFSILDKKSGAYRPVSYRDIVVLMRATSGYANTFVEEFRQAGVPAYAELATGYFEATEVETVLSLLKVIDNPRQDVPLAGVLRSPVVGLDAGELAQIRLCQKKGDFFDALVAAAIGGGALSDRLAQFLEQLERWRTTARRGALSDLIWSLYRETGYYDQVGGLPGGAQRQANLRALYHRARQYEVTVFRGLFLFLRFIERLRDEGRDLGTAQYLSEKENVVRIMSIHKSKGLEFPVVFVAGLGRKFNLKDLNKTILLHKDLGLGPQLVDVETRLTYPTAAKLALKNRLRMEALAEEMRLLYVAMTRARERLVLVGSARKLPECARRWCGTPGTAGWPLPDWQLAGAGSCLDWLVPAVARHRDGGLIRDLGGVEEPPVDAVAQDRSRWQVRVSDGRLYDNPEKTEERDDFWDRVRRLEPCGPPGPLFDEISRRLAWRYPYPGLEGYAAKASVTELKRRFDGQAAPEDESRPGFRPAIGERPRFLQEDRGLTASEYGSALHLVMQHLNIGGDLDAAAIQEQVHAMVLNELLTHEQASAVQVNKIKIFADSPLGNRLRKARSVWRELPFTLALPACEVYPDAEEKCRLHTSLGKSGLEGELVLVQGVIDCLFEEEDGLVLLDYKTDRVKPDQVETLAARYRGQLNLYARAVESILGRKVKEKYLYLFSVGAEVEMEYFESKACHVF